MNRSLTALVTGLALSSLLLTSACDGGGESGDDEAKKPSGSEAVGVVHDSVDSTLAVTSMDITSEAKLQINGQDLLFGVDGPMDYEKMIGDVTLQTSQSGQSQEVEVRADGEKVWFRIDSDTAAAAIPQGKTWAEGNVATLENSDSFEPIGLVGVVVALRGAKEVKVGDSKEIDGVPARQFTTTVVYSDAVEAAGDDREGFNSALSLTGVDDADLDIEVWIGDDGVIRDFNLDINTDKPVDGTYDVEITGANEDVDAPDAPNSDDVLTGPEAEAWIAQVTGA